MKMLRTFIWTGPFLLFFLLFAAPAFAQFEVSPDHFDDQPTQAKKAATSTKKNAASANPSALPAAAAKKNVTANGVSAKGTSQQSAANIKTRPPKRTKTASARLHAKKAAPVTASARYANAAGSPAARE